MCTARVWASPGSARTSAGAQRMGRDSRVRRVNLSGLSWKIAAPGGANLLSPKLRNSSPALIPQPYHTLRADDPFAKPFNETEVKRTLQDMDEDEQRARITDEENWERAKHVVPRNFLTEKFWYKKLRACCLCGLLKTQPMWLEVTLASPRTCLLVRVLPCLSSHFQVSVAYTRTGGTPTSTTTHRPLGCLLRPLCSLSLAASTMLPPCP